MFFRSAAAVAQPLRDEHAAHSSAIGKGDESRVQRAQEEVRPQRKKKRSFALSRVSQNEKIFFMDNLATMLNAGLSLSLAVATIEAEAKSRVMRNALVSIKHEIDSGRQFSEALEDHPEIFSPMFIAVVRVGEASGSLADVLSRLAEIAKKNKALQGKAINAMIYPTVVLVAMICIVIVLMIYVFPQLISIFKEMNVQLPLQTRILIGSVDFLQVHGLWLLLGFLSTVLFLGIGMRIKRIKYFFHFVMLKIPFVGGVMKETILTRATGNLRLLLMSGVPIIQALRIVSDTAGNLVYQRLMSTIAKEVELGQPLYSIVAKRPKYFPTLVVTMFKVGEETGKFDDILGKLERFYETRVENVFANLSTIIEPVLLLSIGVMVGFIAVSVIMPIYNLAQAF